VGSPERIHHVADRIAERHAAGDRLVVVVSAMGATTDELMQLAQRVTDLPSRRELDMLLTAGERISMALLSMCLNTRRVPAISFTGSQSGIITDSNHTRARILEVRPIRIGPELDRGKVVIVAGFQGVSREKEVTTLGRGGSDTTAVALAAGLGAAACEIYSDVPGVMTADPRIVPEARLIPELSWDAMLEMAGTGAGVMHARAVALARRHRIPFAVRSSFKPEEGTMVEGKPIEAGAPIVSVTGRSEVTRVVLNGIQAADPAPILDAVRSAIEEPHSLRATRHEPGWEVAFLIPEMQKPETVLNLVQPIARAHGGTAQARADLAAVSVVAAGAFDEAEAAARAATVLAAADAAPVELLPGNLSLTFLVPRERFAAAQAALHDAFLRSDDSG
jgi:aspartate kinase